MSGQAPASLRNYWRNRETHARQALVIPLLRETGCGPVDFAEMLRSREAPVCSCLCGVPFGSFVSHLSSTLRSCSLHPCHEHLTSIVVDLQNIPLCLFSRFLNHGVVFPVVCFKMGSQVAQASLKHLVVQSSPPEFWDQRAYHHTWPKLSCRGKESGYGKMVLNLNFELYRNLP